MTRVLPGEMNRGIAIPTLIREGVRSDTGAAGTLASQRGCVTVARQRRTRTGFPWETPRIQARSTVPIVLCECSGHCSGNLLSRQQDR